MKTDHPRLLVTRPGGQADHLVEKCEALGVEVIHAPCLEISATGVKIEGRDLANTDAVLFTSSNAVVHANQTLPLPWTGIDVYAIGDATTKALEVFGQAVTAEPLPPYTSESFVTLLKQQSALPRQLLIVKGSGGRGYIESRFKTSSITVKTLDVYQRQCPKPTASLRSLLSTPVDLISVMSNETLDNLIHLATPLRSNLFKQELLVSSERSRDHALDKGFTGNILVAPYAGDSGQLEALSGWLLNHEVVDR